MALHDYRPDVYPTGVRDSVLSSHATDSNVKTSDQSENHFPLRLSTPPMTTALLPNGERECVVAYNPTTCRSSAEAHPDRGYWGHKAEFILSCIGLSVGIGNVWRFPYMAYDNGGGAFLIPYLIMLAVIGKPLYLLELSIGQYARLGPGQLFDRMSPITAGIGISMLYSCLLICIYYNVIMSYAVYFTAATSMSAVRGEDQLPWDVCDPAWADTATCWVRYANETTSSNTSASKKVSTEQYFYRKVLQKYDLETNLPHTVADLGQIVPELFGCLAFCWLIVYICLVRGIKSSGKVVYVTATLPYVLLLVLLIRGLFLEGAWDGISYFITPTWKKLFQIRTWRAAATQLFYSLGTSAGSLIMFGSYNRFHNNCHFDALFVSSLDTVTSIIAGFVVFAQLGNLAAQVRVPVEDVAKGGLGLAFIVYPEAISKLPYPHFWGVCFFGMLFTLGLDTQFALIEVVITALGDFWPLHFRRRRWLVTGIFCIVGLICGLPCVCQGGLDVVDIMDVYGGSFSILFIAVFELTAVSWFYGVENFAKDLKFMLRRRKPLSLYWKICWKFVAPLLLTMIVIATLADYQPLSTSATYPKWADFLGWGMALVAIASPPVWAMWKVASAEGNTLREKFQRARAPRATWGPGICGEDLKAHADGRKSGEETEVKLLSTTTTIFFPLS